MSRHRRHGYVPWMDDTLEDDVLDYGPRPPARAGGHQAVHRSLDVVAAPNEVTRCTWCIPGEPCAFHPVLVWAPPACSWCGAPAVVACAFGCHAACAVLHLDDPAQPAHLPTAWRDLVARWAP